MKWTSVKLQRLWPIGALAVLGILLNGPLSPVASDDADKKNFGKAVEAVTAIDHRNFRVGQLIEDLTFTDLAGKKGKLSDYSKHKALVISLRTVGCPLSKKYSPRIESIAKEFTKKNIAFLYVNVGEADTAAAMKAEQKKYGLTQRYVVDKKRVFAKTLAGMRTTDVFVLDSSRTLIYRGAIDDQYGIGFARDKASRHHLKEALDHVLTGESLEFPATSAPGCELGVKVQTTPTAKPTWHNRISRIVQQNCMECHRAGENAPFSLESLKDVKANRAMIKRVIGNKTMPPWFADKKVGDFANDKSLSAADRKAMIDWIDGGCAKGDKADKMVKRNWYKGWRLGRPSAVISLPEAFEVPAEGTVPYKYSRVSTHFAEDKWIRSIEIRPGATEAVHHVLVFLRYPKEHPRFRDQPRVRGGLRGYFAGMVPGQSTMEFPKGTAKFLPKGAQIIFQIHYTTNGAKAKDRTKMGLYFNDGKPKHEFHTRAMAQTRFQIPPGAGNHKVVAETRLRKKVRLFGFNPHMHVRGKAFKYEIVKEDGSTQMLLNVPRYDFNWQLNYKLRKPLDLPAGTRLRATAWFDNSKANPANPDPSKAVRFGEQTWDEMMIGYYNVYDLKD